MKGKVTVEIDTGTPKGKFVACVDVDLLATVPEDNLYNMQRAADQLVYAAFCKLQNELKK